MAAVEGRCAVGGRAQWRGRGVERSGAGSRVWAGRPEYLDSRSDRRRGRERLLLERR